MKNVNQETLARFAGLVAKVWNDKELAKSYKDNPGKVLQDYNIKLPKGVPMPVIPARPRGVGTEALGATFKKLTFESWDLTVHDLKGGGAQAISVSSLA